MGVWNYGTITLQVIKQVQKNSPISDVLPDNVWQYNVKHFLSYLKIIPSSFDLLNPRSVEMKVKNFKNLNILRMKKVLRWNK